MISHLFYVHDFETFNKPEITCIRTTGIADISLKLGTTLFNSERDQITILNQNFIKYGGVSDARLIAELKREQSWTIKSDLKPSMLKGFWSDSPEADYTRMEVAIINNYLLEGRNLDTTGIRIPIKISLGNGSIIGGTFQVKTSYSGILEIVSETIFRPKGSIQLCHPAGKLFNGVLFKIGGLE